MAGEEVGLLMAMLSTELDCLELGCGRKEQRFPAV